MPRHNLPPVFDLPYTAEEFTMWLLQDHDNSKSLVQQEILHRVGYRSHLSELTNVIEKRYRAWTSHVARKFPHLYSQKDHHEWSASTDITGSIALGTEHKKQIWVAGVFIRDFTSSHNDIGLPGRTDVSIKDFVNEFTKNT